MQTNTQRHEEPPSFVAANPRRLMPSQAIIEEYALGAGPRNKRGYLAEYRDAVGYVFPWGHVIESPPGPRSPDGDHDERHPICSWDFCLDEALADHHNAGLSLADLTEHALVMLDEMQTHHLWWPEIRYGDGESASTFDLWVMGEENIVLARRWLDEVFLTVFMVDVLSGVATVCRHIAQERDESGAR